MLRMDGAMLGEMTKSYPPEIQQLRDLWLVLLEETKRRVEPSNPTTAIVIAAGYDTSPAACARRVRAYQDAVEFIVQHLADLETYAIPSWIVPATH